MTIAEIEKVVAEQMAILVEDYPDSYADEENYQFAENFMRSCLYKKYGIKGG